MTDVVRPNQDSDKEDWGKSLNKIEDKVEPLSDYFKK
jgi:hypothetical protein